MAEKTAAEVPYAVLEYTATFKKPIWKAQPPVRLIADLLEALGPWGFGVDGVEIPNVTTLKDYVINFRRVPFGVVIKVGLTKVVITVDNPDWTQAQDLIDGMDKALNTIVTTAEAQVSAQSILLALHLQLKNKTPTEITEPLVNPRAFDLLDGKVKFSGVILQQQGFSALIDLSLGYPNALFVRFSREHASEANLQAIAEVLRKDEERILDVLGLEGVL